MADWKNTVDFSVQKKSFLDGKLSLQDLAAAAAKAVRSAIHSLNDDLKFERDRIADEFDSIATDSVATAEDFDDVLERLYDWGDTRLSPEWNGKKVAWITP